MRIKFLLIYLTAGAAFLAVSLWLILSGGKSASATRAKFKLGGIMLTAWSMFSAASCGGVPVVSCYEPVEPPKVTCYDVVMETDVIVVSVKDLGGNKLKPGDVMVFNIQHPNAKVYRFRLHSGDAATPVIQEFSFTLPDGLGKDSSFEQVLAPTDYRGEATITVSAVTKDAEGVEQDRELRPVIINIAG